MGAKCGGSLEEVFMSGLKKYTPAIIKLTANKKIIVDLQKVVATFRTESQRNRTFFVCFFIKDHQRLRGGSGGPGGGVKEKAGNDQVFFL